VCNSVEISTVIIKCGFSKNSDHRINQYLCDIDVLQTTVKNFPKMG